ncbi:MAG: hypothetical protein ACI956_001567, partial [Nonlabens sp.]
SGLYNCFHEKNREIIFCVILTNGLFQFLRGWKEKIKQKDS